MNQGNWSFCADPFQILQRSKFAFVQQEIELIEVLTGCETPNKYHVYVVTDTGEQVYIFKCKEKSNWCQRNCCEYIILNLALTLVPLI